MIVSDVDEIVIVDPKAAMKIVDYLQEKYEGTQDYPRNISPLCLELVHVREQEPLPIAKTRTILSRRRIFRPSRNYSKPCLVGAPVQFGPGGHRNNLGLRHMPDDLYTLHLKFCDLGIRLIPLIPVSLHLVLFSALEAAIFRCRIHEGGRV